MIAIILIDKYTNNSDVDENNYKGYILVVVATFLLSCTNIAQETVLEQAEQDEYIGCVGLSGILISLVYVLIFERESKYPSSTITILAMLGFVVSIFCFYTLTAVFSNFYQGVF